MNDFERASVFDGAIQNLGESVKKRLMYIGTTQKALTQEVRLRVGCPLQLVQRGRVFYVSQDGKVMPRAEHSGYEVTPQDITESFRIICGYSVHTHQSEIKNGYITVRGGHRAGLCGTAVVENEKVIGVKDISSINLRIATQMDGLAPKSLPADVLFSKKSLIVAGAPCSGKTTLLRDIARALADNGMRVSLVDERSELAAVYNGKPQNKLGKGCDVLNGYPKAFGILTALRALSPDVIVCDEVGDAEEIGQIKSGFHSGVRFVLAIHATDLQDLCRKPRLRELWESGEFGHIVFLGSGPDLGKVMNLHSWEVTASNAHSGIVSDCDCVYHGGDLTV